MSSADKKNRALPISELLQDKHHAIADLCKKARAIQSIDQKLKTYLDPSLHNHFELANIKTDVATLLVSSSTWATRLRYNIPAILNALNNQLNFTSVKTIRIKVKTILPDNTALNKKPIFLSKTSAQVLINVANNFHDPELRACILKLSKNYIK